MGLKYKIENGEVTIISYTDKSAKSVIIPEFIDGVPVTGIRDFGYLNNVEELIIPKSVTYIHSGAFEYCLRLKSINNHKIENGICVINNRFIKFSNFIHTIRYQIIDDYSCDFYNMRRFFIKTLWYDEYFNR